MLTVVLFIHYNRTLTAKPVLGGVAVFYRPWHGSFHFVFVVAVPHRTEGIAVPEESAYKPDEQHERHHDRHDHIADLVTQVHEYAHDIEGFGQGKDTDHALKHQNEQSTRMFSLMHGIDGKTNGEFHQRNDGEKDGRFPNPFFKFHWPL